MTDPAPAEVPMAPTPVQTVESWQARFEVLGLLAVLTGSIVAVGRFATLYQQARHPVEVFGAQADLDLLDVLRTTGQAMGVQVGALFLVGYLLVTLGPGDRISTRGVAVLRALVGCGLVATAASVVSACALLVQDTTSDATGRQIGFGSPTDLASRLGLAAPVVMGAVLAGYVAWCAFSTLGETPPLIDPADAG